MMLNLSLPHAAVIGANSYIARNLLYVNGKDTFAKVKLYDYGPKQVDDLPNYNQLDLTSKEQVGEAIQDCDLVYFFIGKTGTIQGFDSPELFLHVNEGMLLTLLNACREYNPRVKIIFPSTRLVYKGSDDLLAEDADKAFLTPYAIQKYACEQYLKMYHNLYGIKYCVLRICVPYGSLVYPVSSYGTLEMFRQQAEQQKKIKIFGNGKQKRTFTYIGDLVKILWLAGLHDSCINDVYNIGGSELSISFVAEKIASFYDVPVEYLPWPTETKKLETGSTVFASDKLDNIIGKLYKGSIEKWLSAGEE